MEELSNKINKLKHLKLNTGITQNSLALAFVQCVTMCTGIIQTMILSRALTKQEYGTYSQGLLIINFAIPFLMLGLSNSITYFSGQKDLDHKKYVDSIMGFIVLLGLFGFFAILIGRRWIIGYFDNDMLNGILICVAIRPLLLNLVTAIQTLYIANNMSLYIAARNLIIAVFQIVIILIGTFVFHNIAVIFALLIAMDVVQIIFMAAYFKRNIYGIQIYKIDLKMVKPLFQYAVPLALSTMMSTLSVYMDKLIIGRMMGTEEFALYSNMSKELPFSFIVSSFTTVVTPVLVRLKAEDDKNFKTIWKNYMEFGYISTWILCGGAIVCAPELLNFLYSEKYSSGIGIFVIYLLISCLRFSYFGIVLSAYGKTNWIFVCTCVTLGSNLILNILLIKPLGMLGPALASLIVIFLMSIFQIILSCKLADCPFWYIFNPKKVITLILEMIAAGLILTVMKDRLEIHYIAKLILTYGFFVGVLGLLNRKALLNAMKNLNRA